MSLQWHRSRLRLSSWSVIFHRPTVHCATFHHAPCERVLTLALMARHHVSSRHAQCVQLPVHVCTYIQLCTSTVVSHLCTCNCLHQTLCLICVHTTAYINCCLMFVHTTVYINCCVSFVYTQLSTSTVLIRKAQSYQHLLWHCLHDCLQHSILQSQHHATLQRRLCNGL